jgi:hypothetical protein
MIAARSLALVCVECLPPDWNLCLCWEVMEVVFGWIDAWVPTIGDLLFNEAFNHRLGTEGLKAPELFLETVHQGYAPGELPTLIELGQGAHDIT